MKKDKEVVLEAVKTSKSAFEFDDEILKSDKDILELIMKKKKNSLKKERINRVHQLVEVLVRH